MTKQQGSHGFAKMRQNAVPPFPLVAVFPQCPLPHTWNEPVMLSMVVAVLRQTLQEFHGDQRRVYLFGHSMGGVGVWALASAYPELFAAVVLEVSQAGAEQNRGYGSTDTWEASRLYVGSLRDGHGAAASQKTQQRN